MGNEGTFCKMNWLYEQFDVWYQFQCVLPLENVHTSLILLRTILLLKCVGALLKREKVDFFRERYLRRNRQKLLNPIVLSHQSSNCLKSFWGLCWGKCVNRVLHAWPVAVHTLSRPTAKATRTCVRLCWSSRPQTIIEILFTDAWSSVSQRTKAFTLQLTIRILWVQCFNVFVLKSGCTKSGRPLKGLCFVIRCKGRHCDWVLNWRGRQAEWGWEGGDQEWGIGGLGCQSSEGIGDSTSWLYSLSCL